MLFPYLPFYYFYYFYILLYQTVVLKSSIMWFIFLYYLALRIKKLANEFKFAFQVCRYASGDISFHTHDCYELVYYLGGSGTTQIGESLYAYQPQYYAIIAPNTRHNESHALMSEVICVGFVPQNAAMIGSGLYCDTNNRILQLVRDLECEARCQQTLYQDMIAFKIGELLIEFARAQTSSQPAEKNLIYVTQFIAENYHQNITVKQLADLCGYSYHYFRHLFKRQFGLSPINYIINVRIGKAAQLLTQTNLSVTEIANICGFSETSQFSALFKRFHGLSPYQFKRGNHLG